MNPLGKVLSWYFNKNSLPYWCVFLTDSVVVFFSGVFAYWMFNKTAALVDNRFEVLNTLLIYTFFAMLGFRLFRTYSGVVRFSSFIDLMRVAYGSLVSMLIALCYSFVMEVQDVQLVSKLSQTEIVTMFVIATLLM